MATIQQIEKMKTLFEQGKTPTEVAKAMNENRYRISSLARLLGFSFVQAKRDPMNWYSIEDNKKKRVFFSLINLDLETKVKMYRVKEISEKTREIVIEYK